MLRYYLPEEVLTKVNINNQDGRDLDQGQYNKVFIMFTNIVLCMPASMHFPGRVAQSVTCLATDVSLTADPGVASSIPAWSHTFVEFDYEIIFTVILLPSAESFMKGCCQLQANVCARNTG